MRSAFFSAFTSQMLMGRGKSVLLSLGNTPTNCPGFASLARLVSIHRSKMAGAISFWESTVSQAVRADTSVQEAIRLLVGLSGTEIGIMADSDTRFSRGQTFFGSVRNHVDHLVSSLGCRGWISSGVFYMVRPNQRLTVIRIDESDLLDVPVSMRDGCHRIRTDVVGRLPGAMVEIRSRNIKGTYRLIAQEIRADNEQGDWICEMTIIKDTEVDGWEGIL